MEKCLVWFYLSLKKNSKKPGMWFLLAAMLFLLWMTAGIQMPDAENTQVAVCLNGSDYTTQLEKVLTESKTEFTFVPMQDEVAVRDAVESGRAECGFVFAEDFDERIAEGDWEETVQCYTSPFGTKTQVAKENLYAAMFPIYSRWLLAQTEEEIYRKSSADRLEKLLEKHDEYVGGDLILTMEVVHVKTKPEMSEKGKSGQTQSKAVGLYPIQGLVELFLLLAMLLSSGAYGNKETVQIESALPVGKKMLFRYVNIIAAAAVSAVVGLMVILVSGQSRGIGTELFAVCGTVFVGGAGVLVFSKLFRNRLTYLSWAATLVLCFLLLRFGIAGYIAH